MQEKMTGWTWPRGDYFLILFIYRVLQGDCDMLRMVDNVP